MKFLSKKLVLAAVLTLMGISGAKGANPAKAFLDRNPNPTEDEVREALAGNICRCGNYKRITECVLAAAAAMHRGV